MFNSKELNKIIGDLKSIGFKLTHEEDDFALFNKGEFILELKKVQE